MALFCGMGSVFYKGVICYYFVAMLAVFVYRGDYRLVRVCALIFNWNDWGCYG